MLHRPHFQESSLNDNTATFHNAVDEFHDRKDPTSINDAKRYRNTAIIELSPEESIWDTDLEESFSDFASELDRSTTGQCKRVFTENDLIPSKFIMDRLTVRSARLSHDVLRANELKVLAEALVGNHCVRSLDLRGNRIDHKGMKELHNMLLKNTYITELNLADNNIGKKGSKYISMILRDSKVLRELNVSGNSLSDARAFEIAHGVAANKSLKTLNLSHNQFMSTAGKDLGLAIEMNQSIVELDLSWNHLRLQGAIDFSSGLAWNKSICILNLSFNGFSDCGAEAMGTALAVNDTLESLNLSHNRISNTGCVALSKGLSKNKFLKKLNVGYNPITNTGCMPLIKAIQKAEGIVEIAMDEIYIDEGAVCLIQELMSQRPNFVARYRGVARPNCGSSSTDDLSKARTKIFTILKRYLRRKNLRMLDLFNKWDRDKTLLLTPDEFVFGFREANIALSQDMLDVLISTLDKNGDGEISYEEFVAVTKIK